MSMILKDFNDKPVTVDYVEITCRHFDTSDYPSYFLHGHNCLTKENYLIEMLMDEPNPAVVVKLCDKAKQISEEIERMEGLVEYKGRQMDDLVNDETLEVMD